MQTTGQTIMNHGILQHLLGSCVDVKWATGGWRNITSARKKFGYMTH